VCHPFVGNGVFWSWASALLTLKSLAASSAVSGNGGGVGGGGVVVVVVGVVVVVLVVGMAVVVGAIVVVVVGAIVAVVVDALLDVVGPRATAGVPPWNRARMMARAPVSTTVTTGRARRQSGWPALGHSTSATSDPHRLL
jgi:hypothetical protein